MKWYVKNSDGKVFGPVDDAKLLAWVRDGRVEPFAGISNDLKTWRLASLEPSLEMDWIVENENLDEEAVNETRGVTQQNKFSNEVAWARQYLVYGGYIDNLERGVWRLSKKGKSVEMTNALASQIVSDHNRNNSGNALADDESRPIHYWIYSPGENAGIWNECCDKGVMAIGWDEIGDLNQYTSKTEMKQAMKEHIDPERSYTIAAHATWQFTHDIQPGDIVFAKKGRSAIIGRGVVRSDYKFDESRDGNKNVRKVDWTHKGEWPHPGLAAMKTLTDITSYTDYVEKLNALFESDEIDDVEAEEVSYPAYAKEDFLKKVYMDEADYDILAGLVLSKKNVILQGAPGVGKTYAAQRLAYSIMGEKNQNRVMTVQFHQSYSYEDFIEGKWELLDTIYADAHSTGRQFWWGGNDYTLTTKNDSINIRYLSSY